MNNCFLYRHIRKDTNGVFYVGIGTTFSYKRYGRAYSKNYRNSLWRNIVKKAGFDWEIVIENMTTEEAKAKEKEFILLYGRRDLGTGPLVNMTDGGDGVNSFRHTEANKQAARQRSLDRNKKGLNPRLGTTHSDESKYLMRAAKIGKTYGPEMRSNLSKAKSVGIYEVCRESVLIGRFHSSTVAAKETGIPGRSLAQLASNGKTGHHGKAKGITVLFTPNTADR